MKITFKKGLLAAIAALTVCSARADEGMWLLQLMKQQNSIDMMKKQGLKLEADDLYNPNGVSLKDAVGIFGGGCTGEIISPEGLILTNHHCGYGAIQQHSSVEHDYLTDGFWAMNRSEELPTPGLKFRFVHRIVDITDLVNAKIKAGEVTEIDALTSPFLSKLAKEELEKSDLKGKPGIEVRALPFYAGNKFYMFYYKVYSDVRMVAAPPSSVGKFGGETDNWMWPRHTGDFSMFRIYADANGEPAEYSESNVPLKTPKFLPISIKGLNEGDYAMIMGFPGSTERYLTQSEVKQRMNAVNQAMIDMRGVRLEVLRKYMDASDKTRIQYASKFAGSSNYWKNSIGMNKAIIDNDVLGAKAEIEKKYAAFAQGKPEYEGVVEKIDAIIEKSTPTLRQLYYTNEALRGAIEFGSTYLIMDNIKKALEEKNDSLLQASKKQLENAYDGIHNKDYDHEVDRAVAKAILPALAKALNADELPSFYQTINGEFKGDYNAYVDNIYDNSILSNRKNLDKFLANKAHNMLVGPEARGIAFRNIRFHDNIVLENRQNDGIYPGAMAVMIADNGTFEDIAFENIIVEDIDGGKVFCAHFTNAWAFDGLYGQWARNITLRNIAYTGTRATPSWIRGRSDAQSIDGVTIGNFTVNGAPVTDGSGPHLEINGYVRNVTCE